MEYLKPTKTNCADCDDLCCKTFSIPELGKKERVPCEYLNDCGGCSIHPSFTTADTRPGICAKYNCVNAGVEITNLFKKYNLPDSPELQEVQGIAFSTMQAQSGLIDQMIQLSQKDQGSVRNGYLKKHVTLLLSMRNEYITKLDQILKNKQADVCLKDISTISGRYLQNIHYEAVSISNEYPRLPQV